MCYVVCYWFTVVVVGLRTCTYSSCWPIRLNNFCFMKTTRIFLLDKMLEWRRRKIRSQRTYLLPLYNITVYSIDVRNIFSYNIIYEKNVTINYIIISLRFYFLRYSYVPPSCRHSNHSETNNCRVSSLSCKPGVADISPGKTTPNGKWTISLYGAYSGMSKSSWWSGTGRGGDCWSGSRPCWTCTGPNTNSNRNPWVPYLHIYYTRYPCRF